MGASEIRGKLRVDRVPAYRGLGVAKQIKEAAFHLSRRRFPQAKLFGLTTGEQVMRINTSLGYVPVTFAKLTDDEEFWAGCKSCVNYDILQRTNMTKCLCTGWFMIRRSWPDNRRRLKRWLRGGHCLCSSIASCCGVHVGGLRVTGFSLCHETYGKFVTCNLYSWKK